METNFLQDLLHLGRIDETPFGANNIIGKPKLIYSGVPQGSLLLFDNYHFYLIVST